MHVDGRVAALSSDDRQLQADFELDSDLRAFQSEYRDGRAEAVLRLDARLVHTATRRIVASRSFALRAPATDTAVLTEVSRNKRIQPLLIGRPSPQSFVIDAWARGHIKQELLKIGWPAEELAGYTPGTPHPIELVAQRLAVLQAIDGQALGESKASRQFISLDRLVFGAQVSRAPNVSRPAVGQSDKGRHARRVGAAERRDHGTHFGARQDRGLDLPCSHYWRRDRHRQWPCQHRPIDLGLLYHPCHCQACSGSCELRHLWRGEFDNLSRH